MAQDLDRDYLNIFNFAAIIPVYKDEVHALRLLTELTWLNNKDILIMLDGKEAASDNFKKIIADKGIKLLQGERLKNKNGGEWLHRIFVTFLKEFPQYDGFLRFDPDTKVWRDPNYFPNNQGIFCETYNTHKLGKTIQSSCMGVWKNAAIKLIRSGVLINEKFSDLQRWGYPRYTTLKFPEEAESEEPIAFTEEILTLACRTLNIRVDTWGEVEGSIKNRTGIPNNEDLKWFATHPHRQND